MLGAHPVPPAGQGPPAAARHPQHCLQHRPAACHPAACHPAACLLATRGPPTRVSRSPFPGHAAACLPPWPPSCLAHSPLLATPLHVLLAPSVPPPPCHHVLLAHPGQAHSGAPHAPALPSSAGAGPRGDPPTPQHPPLEGLAQPPRRAPKDGGAGHGTRCPSPAARRRLSLPRQDRLLVPPGSPGQRHACQAWLGEAWGGDTPHLALFTVKPELEGCRWATSQEHEPASREGSGGDMADPWAATPCRVPGCHRHRAGDKAQSTGLGGGAALPSISKGSSFPKSGVR